MFSCETQYQHLSLFIQEGQAQDTVQQLALSQRIALPWIQRPCPQTAVLLQPKGTHAEVCNDTTRHNIKNDSLLEFSTLSSLRPSQTHMLYVKSEQFSGFFNLEQ